MIYAKSITAALQAAGRRLLANSGSADSTVTAELAGSNGQQHVEVNLTIQAPTADLSNITALLQDAINSGQLASALNGTG